MDLGEQQREIEISPAEEPVPREQPAEQPAETPAREREPVPA